MITTEQVNEIAAKIETLGVDETTVSDTKTAISTYPFHLLYG